jgi:hypothetical protein
MHRLTERVLCECVYRCVTASLQARLLSIDIHATLVEGIISCSPLTLTGCLCTKRLRIENFGFRSTECAYSFGIVLRKKVYIFLYIFALVTVITEAYFVYCEIHPGSLNIFQSLRIL